MRISPTTTAALFLAFWMLLVVIPAFNQIG